MLKSNLYFFVLIVILSRLLMPLDAFSQNKQIILTSKWQFKQKGKPGWNSATVPGCVHTDLLNNKLIGDPFYSDNEKDLQWIENEDWEYRTSFQLDKIMFQNNHIELHFAGLDTYAKVYLNDSLILVANNMFRSWNIEVKKLIKPGVNTLSIIFESAVKKGKEAASKLPYTLPGEEKVFTRKAQYQYGWDWGPRFVTCGIWKPIVINTWNDVKIENFNYVLKELNDSIAKIQFITNILSDKEQNISRCVLPKYISKNPNLKQLANTVKLKKGWNIDTVELSIHHPKLWWCNGLGKANLYDFRLYLLQKDKISDTKDLQIGLRKIELIQQKDSAGTSFFFKLNGIPVFMKGANYIPPDNFLSKLKTVDHKNTVQMAKDANMNMLRVWGGGVYADDAFYSECDKQGVLVWQDLMFACAMYPGDKEFIENVSEEIKEQIDRLKDHPCLALWCGNNEVDEGWKNWEWQKEFKYSKNDSSKIWNDYNDLFNKLIPDLIKINDPKTTYWPSSPSIGWGHKESLTQGDSHYWGVWWGMEPFENYEIKIGRFMSEYGFQGMPELSTFKKICSEKDLNLNSEAVRSHQKNAKGYATIQTYMEREYKIPQKFEDYIYISQLLQAKGMRTAIEAHRSAKPYCTGTLMWQLNDCWPVTSWSAIDYFQNKKAVYYSIQKAFKTLIVTAKKQNDAILISLISDSTQLVKGNLNIQLLDFNGKLIWKKTQAFSVSNSSNQNYFLKKSELPNIDSTQCYLKIKFTGKDVLLCSSNYFFTKPKHLILPKSNIILKKTGDSTYLISSDVFTKDVCISSENGVLGLSDNFFDLEPGIPKTIKVTAPLNTKSILKLKALCLNNL